MDEVNINKYLSQFNPILIVPVLSAVVGAILVFVFGFKRPNEPRFQCSSSIDSIKKSKRRTNPTKSSDSTSSKQQIVSSAKVAAGKKTTDTVVVVANKKGSVIEKSNSNNNNTNSNSNNNGSKKKSDEKKSENGSPIKRGTNKKTSKESTTSVTKKSKTNRDNSSGGTKSGEKPADFDDGGWFTVQSKSTKQKNKIDDSTANQTENSSPKVQRTKNNKAAKSSKIEKLIAQATPNELNNASEIVLPESKVEQQSSKDEPFNVAENEVAETSAPAVDEEPAFVATNDVIVQPVTEKKPTAPVPLDVADTVAQSAIAFDELGEWTDAKPDRKRVNKKKSRKD